MKVIAGMLIRNPRSSAWWLTIMVLLVPLLSLFFLFSHSPPTSAQETDSPPSIGGLTVRCLHKPIWPQATDQTITITGEALQDDLSPKLGTSVDIYVNDVLQSPSCTTTSTAPSCAVTISTTSFTAGDIISYGCRAAASANQQVWAGHSMQFGAPVTGQIVPILYTRPHPNSLDIFFIPDQDSYGGGATDTQFLGSVHSVIKQAYYDERIFLSHQDRINFWISREPVSILSFPEACKEPGGAPGQDCALDFPPNQNFANVMILLHKHGSFTFRDFGNPNLRLFSARQPPNSTKKHFLHHTGHIPFGLADEYPPNGGYFQTSPLPNLYAVKQNCDADVVPRGIPDPPDSDPCMQVPTQPWFRLDSTLIIADIMGFGSKLQAADIQRIEWFFGQCEIGNCAPLSLPEDSGSGES